MAILHAIRICGWQENLTEDEMPPDWMWSFEDLLEPWFEEVDEKRKARFGGNDRDTDTTVPMMENELARGRK